MKVLLLDNIHQTAVEHFTQAGYHVETQKGMSEEELIKAIPQIPVLGIRSKSHVTKQVLAKAKKLVAIGAFGIGTNQIDLPEATQQGVAVFNAPYSSARSVAELVLGEIIMLYRKAYDKSIEMHKKAWNKSAAGSFEVRGKKLGIIGYGAIGMQVSLPAENIGMDVYFYNASDKLSLGKVKKCHTLDELLTTCDVIAVHCSGAKANTNLIGAKEFAKMKDGVIFLNHSRGHVVDIDALADAIKQGKVKGCALDVFPNEPKSNTDSFLTPVQGLPNVILTPHIGGSTEEAQKHIGEFVSNKIINYIKTGNTMLSVNLPNHPGIEKNSQNNTIKK